MTTFKTIDEQNAEHHRMHVDTWYRSRGLTPPAPKSTAERLADLQRQIDAMRTEPTPEPTAAPTAEPVGGRRPVDAAWCRACGDRFAPDCEDHVMDAHAELLRHGLAARKAAGLAVDGLARDDDGVTRTEEWLHGQAEAYEHAIRIVTKHTGVCVM